MHIRRKGPLNMVKDKVIVQLNSKVCEERRQSNGDCQVITYLPN